MLYEYRFLVSFFLTLLIETSILFLLIRNYFKIDDISNSLVLFAGIIASFSTLPYLWFLLPQFITSYNILVVAGETSVILAEGVIYYYVLKVTAKRAFALSFVCNLISFITGLLMNSFI
ncbi:hypothetical protein [Methanolobus bombayensis]|uniref:hypothetical protein n=1 Tax=Methanolobus bombayensis TaxID=38023 RepID=UPI001AE4C4F9|nr:hypothetical protein [Methanolobus bombayensis]MBP1908472.1 hypothetical protein [Methanolobus bombayensis]